MESVPGMAKMQASVVMSAAAKKAAKARAKAAAAEAAEAEAEAEGKEGKKGAAAAAKVEGKTATTSGVKKEEKAAGFTGEQAAMEEAARQLRKDELEHDVKVVYKNLLESYKPARPRTGRPSKAGVGGAGTAAGTNGAGIGGGAGAGAGIGGDGAAPKCKGADLIDAARVLLDTKQFVKTYVPVEDLLMLRPPPPTGPNGGSKGKGGRPPMVATHVRVLVTAVIDSRNRGPKVSGMTGKAAKKKHKHGIETKPPPEVVLLPPDPLLSDLKAAANKAFQELYVVLAKYKAGALHSWCIQLTRSS
jgi:hypothetical protein